ncbi:MAG: hypothetical protein ACRD1R_20140 [Acidobacteriota bacterium]
MTLTIVNQDKTTLSKGLIGKFIEDERIDVQKAESLALARQQVRAANRAAAVVIGPAFNQAAAQLQLIDLLDFPTGRFSRGLRGLDIHIYPRSIMPWSRDAIEQLLFYKTLYVLVPHTINRLTLIRAYVEANRPKGPVEMDRENPAAGNAFFLNLVPSTDAIYRTLVPSYAVMFAFFLINITAYSAVGDRSGCCEWLSDAAGLNAIRDERGQPVHLPHELVSDRLC